MADTFSYQIGSAGATQATVDKSGNIEADHLGNRAVDLQIGKKEDKKDVPPVSKAEAGDKGTDGDVQKDDAAAQGKDEAGGDPIGELKSPETFDAGNPDNVVEWDAEYLTEGSINMERFQKEVSKNMLAEGGKAQLNENTYAYLQHKFGVSRKDVDGIIADRLNSLEYGKTQAAQKDKAIFDFAHSTAQGLGSKADGPALLQEAIGWAREGYDKAAQDRFNKVMDGDDADAKQDAIEVLLNRYSRTDAFKTAERDRSRAGRNREPQRDATNGGGSPKGQAEGLITDPSEFRRLKKEAKGDQQKIRALVARYRPNG